MSTLVWSGGLVITGLLLLLFNFGLLERFEPLAQFVVAGCFAAAGFGFFGSFLSNRDIWWRLIPGWTLLSVAGMVLLSTVPAVSPLLIPAVLFVGLAMAFANIYLVNRAQNWWAVIPGGFLLVLSIVIGLNAAMDDLELLFAILLIGLGAVFLLLVVVGPAEAKWWPLVPGLTLGLFGLFLATGGTSEGANLRWWPAVLILIGAGMGWRAVGRRSAPERLSVNVAPGLAPSSKIRTGPGPANSKESGVLGEYSEPAPGASVEVLSDEDDE